MSSHPTWDPVQYRRHADERSRPFFELVGRVGAERPRRVADLGCGDGAVEWPQEAHFWANVRDNKSLCA